MRFDRAFFFFLFFLIPQKKPKRRKDLDKTIHFARYFSRCDSIFVYDCDCSFRASRRSSSSQLSIRIGVDTIDDESVSRNGSKLGREVCNAGSRPPKPRHSVANVLMKSVSGGYADVTIKVGWAIRRRCNQGGLG